MIEYKEDEEYSNEEVFFLDELSSFLEKEEFPATITREVKKSEFITDYIYIVHIGDWSKHYEEHMFKKTKRHMDDFCMENDLKDFHASAYILFEREDE